MKERFVTIWFRFLKTDWHQRRKPALKDIPFALSKKDHGREVISAVNPHALALGIVTEMAVADARVILPTLQILPDEEGHETRILSGLATWFNRYTPWVAIDPPDGLVLNATGCAHLWGGEQGYLTDIVERLNVLGYTAQIAISDTIGASWASSRFGGKFSIIKSGEQLTALRTLPVACLRLQPETTARLHKLGLHAVKDIITMPRSALQRRFGDHILQRIAQAIVGAPEPFQPVHLPVSHQHRLPCLEPILTRTGIEMALDQLLQMLCHQLRSEGKGLRSCTFYCFRVDGKVEQITIGTNRPTAHLSHLFRLFEVKLDGIEPALGIELFMLEAGQVGDLLPMQARLWETQGGLTNTALVELLDRLSTRFGAHRLKRYLPDAHHWPERSVKCATSLDEQPAVPWTSHQRPVQLLPVPASIEVTAPIPDYPPMNFRYKGKLHVIKKADGPKRIEQEWWLQQGEHRDYYAVEDEAGGRYSIFRLGHYDAEKFGGWFLHGFFA